MTTIFYGSNYCGMESTIKRRPGRPPKFKEALARREILVERDVDDEANAIADKTGASVSEVYRGWIARGRAAERKRK